MTFGSLFAGIGGIDLGLERAGMQCRWQVEIDPFCQNVLNRHWPEVKRYSDIREVGSQLESVDLICGGFPCQDISIGNNQNAIGRRGISYGTRSGLWSEYFRVVGFLRPKYVLIENVAALLRLDDFGRAPIARVLSDLASIGYDAEWSVFRACEVGLPHPRVRVFIVAYPNSIGLEAISAETGLQLQANNTRHDGYGVSDGRTQIFQHESVERTLVAEPHIMGSDNGLSKRLGELKAYGNSVVPGIAEWIGKRIMVVEK